MNCSCAASASDRACQQALNIKSRAFGATPTIPSRLLATAAITPGHFRAMPVTPKLRVIRVDEIDRGGDAAAQISMLDIDAGIDDGHLDALASRPGMSARDIHLLKSALQFDIRVVVVLGASGKGLQGWRQPDARVLRQRGKQLTAIGARRESPARRNAAAAARSATH